MVNSNPLQNKPGIQVTPKINFLIKTRHAQSFLVELTETSQNRAYNKIGFKLISTVSDKTLTKNSKEHFFAIEDIFCMRSNFAEWTHKSWNR